MQCCSRRKQIYFRDSGIIWANIFIGSKLHYFIAKNSLRLVGSNQWRSYVFWHLSRLVTVQNSDKNYKLRTKRLFTKFSFTWLKKVKIRWAMNFLFLFLHLKYSFWSPFCLPVHSVSRGNRINLCHGLQCVSNRVSDIWI